MQPEMKITSLNGNPNVEDSGFDDYLTKLKAVLESRNDGSFCSISLPISCLCQSIVGHF